MSKKKKDRHSICYVLTIRLLVRSQLAELSVSPHSGPFNGEYRFGLSGTPGGWAKPDPFWAMTKHGGHCQLSCQKGLLQR